MRSLNVFVVLLCLTTVAGSALGGELPLYVHQGVTKADHSPEWYYQDWMSNSPYSPEFEVLDTESSLGRYATMTKTITIKDLVKLHGHACDGLIFTACALKVAFNELYPDGVIDRTNARGISKNSPCFGDALMYLTGGRIRFDTQDIDNSLGAEWIIQRIDSNKAVKVKMRPGVFPESLKKLEERLKTSEVAPAEIDRCREEQWEISRTVLSRPLEDSFSVEVLKGFSWPRSDYPKVGKRGDIIHRSAPYPHRQQGVK